MFLLQNNECVHNICNYKLIFKQQHIYATFTLSQISHKIGIMHYPFNHC